MNVRQNKKIKKILTKTANSSSQMYGSGTLC